MYCVCTFYVVFSFVMHYWWREPQNCFFFIVSISPNPEPFQISSKGGPCHKLFSAMQVKLIELRKFQVK